MRTQTIICVRRHSLQTNIFPSCSS
uniref:Uncharacterized protein n=1 Tax=Anguilla anguilla TaxID=7936 RepID=A0A0E9SQN1_ANGAN